MRLLFFVASIAVAQTPSYPVKPVPFTAVHFHDDFWAPRIEINRKATIPAAFAWTGVPALFERTGYEEMERDGAQRPVYTLALRKRS